MVPLAAGNVGLGVRIFGFQGGPHLDEVKKRLIELSLKSLISADDHRRPSAKSRTISALLTSFPSLCRIIVIQMAEAGAYDATLMAVAGHMSRRMLGQYSHVRMAAKRTALEKLESGLMGVLCNEPTRVEESELSPHVTTTPSNSSLCLYLFEMCGGRDRTRTCDLLRVKQAL